MSERQSRNPCLFRDEVFQMAIYLIENRAADYARRVGDYKCYTRGEVADLLRAEKDAP